jgi:hypothetical protein
LGERAASNGIYFDSGIHIELAVIAKNDQSKVALVMEEGSSEEPKLKIEKLDIGEKHKMEDVPDDDSDNEERRASKRSRLQ